MSTISPYLRMTLQELDENPDTWGGVLNVSALELLEDGIAATGECSMTLGNVTLDDTSGGPSSEGPSPVASARVAILEATGTPGGTNDIIVPSRSKHYIVYNNTSDSSSVRVITSGGTGITIPAGAAYFVFCDGVNVLTITTAVATTASSATTAANATALGGVAAAGYPQIAQQNTYTAGQATQRVALTAVGSVITPDIALSNAFYYLTNNTDGNFTLAAPANPVNGAMFSLVIEQGVGAPHTIAFASNTFLWKDGTAIVLSTTLGDIDYLAFEYCTNLSVGARWLASSIKGIS